MLFLDTTELFFSFGKVIKGEGGGVTRCLCINPLCMFDTFFFIIF